MNKKQQYLDYIDKLYQRQSEASKSQGVTTWVLLTGIVFVVWRLLPHSVHFNDTNFLNSTLLIYFHSYFCVVFIYTLLQPDSSYRNATPFDYRIRSINVIKISKTSVYLITAIVAPLVIAFNTVKYSNTHTLYFNFTYSILVLFLLFVSLFFSFHFRYEKSTGFPHATMLRRHPEKSKLAVFGRLSSVTMDLGLLAANLVSLLICLEAAVSDNQLLNSVESGFCLAIVNLLAILLFQRLQQSDDLTPYLRIERDIVLHELSDGEIKDRIEQDLIGNVDLYSWLSKKQFEIDELLGEFDDKLATTLAELDGAVPLPENKKDKEVLRSRMVELRIEHNEAHRRYATVSKRFIDWIASANKQLLFSDDPYFEKLLDENLDKMSKREDELLRKMSIAEERVKKSTQAIYDASKSKTDI